MTDKTIDNLIDNLSENWAPKRRLWHPVLRVMPWAILSLLYLAASVHYIGPRPDLSAALGQSVYIFELSLSLCTAFMAALSAAWLAIPDSGGRRWLPIIPTTLFMGLILMMCNKLYLEGFILPHGHIKDCFTDALLFGFVPMAMLAMLLKRGRTTRPYWMAGMNILAVATLGWVGLRLTCAVDNVSHAYIYHFAPYILFGLMFGLLAKRIFRW